MGWGPWGRRDHLQFFPGDLRSLAMSQELRLLHLCCSPFDVMDQLESPRSDATRRCGPSGSFAMPQQDLIVALLDSQAKHGEFFRWQVGASRERGGLPGTARGRAQRPSSYRLFAGSKTYCQVVNLAQA
jgi:hypothetical protein